MRSRRLRAILLAGGLVGLEAGGAIALDALGIAERLLAPAGPSALLALFEKGVADAVPAILRKQHRFAEIKDAGNVVAARAKRLGEFSGMVRHGRCGRGADQPFAIERACNKGSGTTGISAQIVLLIRPVAVIEIGKGAEDRDAQARKVGDMRRHRFAMDNLDLHDP